MMDASPRSAQRTGRYVLQSKLAEGGMGEIFLARLEGVAGFQKLLVVKRLKPALAQQPRFVDMFFEEARLTAELTHPNICQVYELGAERGEYFIAMEYLQGMTLRQILSRYDAPLPLRVIAALVAQACEGLHYAHEKITSAASEGLIHRDVSPENLFLTFDGVIKVLDFGIARRSESRALEGSLAGKVTYLAPERVLGDAIDHRADIFSLGVVLYELISGANPFRRDTHEATLAAIENHVAPPLEARCDAVLSAVIARALEKDPAQRFQSARAFGLALHAAMTPVGGAMALSETEDWLKEAFPEAVAATRTRLSTLLETSESQDGASVYSAFTQVGILSTHVKRSEVPCAANADDIASAEAVPTSITASEDAVAPRAAASPPASRRLAVLVAVLGAVLVAVVAIRQQRAQKVSHQGGDARHRSLSTSGIEAHSDPQQRVAADVHRVPVALDAGETATPPSKSRQRSRRQTQRKRPRRASSPSTSRPTSRPDSQTEHGYLTIDSFPYARIYVDDTQVGVTPLHRLAVAAGRHHIKAVLEDGRHKTFQITIVAGAEATRKRLDWP